MCGIIQQMGLILSADWLKLHSIQCLFHKLHSCQYILQTLASYLNMTLFLLLGLYSCKDGYAYCSLILGPSSPSENSMTPAVALQAATLPAWSPQEVQPPKAKKPKVLELPSSSTLLPPGLSLDQVNAAVNSLLAPGSATNTLTPTVFTSHSLVSDMHTSQCHIKIN